MASTSRVRPHLSALTAAISATTLLATYVCAFGTFLALSSYAPAEETSLNLPLMIESCRQFSSP